MFTERSGGDSAKTLAVKLALEMGFDLARVTTAAEFTEARAATLERLQAGLLHGLPWFTEERVKRGANPQALLPGARSIVCLGLNYYHEAPPPAEGMGRVARYAQGRDYHHVMKRRMRDYVAALRQRLGADVSGRWFVDDGPMLDRAAAQRAGLGWFGKNANILTPQLGSWVLLGQVITDLELEPDAPLAKSCGSCARCLPACPTGAITAPGVVDNWRCVSYQTIENRGAIPTELRPLIGDWVFGCDICQEVCPVNRKAQPTADPAFRRPDLAALNLVELLDMPETEFRRRFSGTPLMRARWQGMQRNACVVLGNRRAASAVPALARALSAAPPLVRGHAAWALGQIATPEALSALRAAAAAETDPATQTEIAAAIIQAEGAQK